MKALALAALLAATSARAETLAIPRSKVTLAVPDGWAVKAAPGTVVGRTRDGRTLVVTRAPIPNPDAWRTKHRDAYFTAVERGFAASIPGYRRTAKRTPTIKGIPTLELEATRSGGTVVVTRILLFRTYALAVAIESPPAALAESRTIASTFAPTIDYTSDTP